MYLKMLIIIFAVLGIYLVLENNKEGFSAFGIPASQQVAFGIPASQQVAFGIYPQSVQRGLLYPAYQMKNNPRGLSNLNMEKAYKLYPTHVVGSYAQTTNNKRYWKTPCNGKTTPPNMCGGLYENKHYKQQSVVPPRNFCRRVNYFCSNI